MRKEGRWYPLCSTIAALSIHWWQSIERGMVSEGKRGVRKMRRDESMVYRG